MNNLNSIDSVNSECGAVYVVSDDDADVQSSPKFGGSWVIDT